MEKVVTNTTVLIFLGKIKRLDLLEVFKTIYTTEEVYKEIFSGKDIPEEEKELLKEFFLKRIKTEKIKEQIKVDLGKGEKSAISLCLKKNIPFFLSDDKKAKRTAELISIKTIGSLGVILENLRTKKIKKKEAKDILNILLENSYYISIPVYQAVLKEIEDWKE